MPTINSTQQIVANGLAHVMTWAGLVSGDDGVPYEFGQFRDRSVQADGNFGGATLVIEGSNDGVSYTTLRNAFGDPLAFTSPGLQSVLEPVRFIRPRVVGGASAAINTRLFAGGGLR